VALGGAAVQPNMTSNGSQPIRSEDKSNVIGGWLTSLISALA